MSEMLIFFSIYLKLLPGDSKLVQGESPTEFCVEFKVTCSVCSFNQCRVLLIDTDFLKRIAATDGVKIRPPLSANQQLSLRFLSC